MSLLSRVADWFKPLPVEEVAGIKKPDPNHSNVVLSNLVMMRLDEHFPVLVARMKELLKVRDETHDQELRVLRDWVSQQLTAATQVALKSSESLSGELVGLSKPVQELVTLYESQQKTINALTIEIGRLNEHLLGKPKPAPKKPAAKKPEAKGKKK